MRSDWGHSSRAESTQGEEVHALYSGNSGCPGAETYETSVSMKMVITSTLKRVAGLARRLSWLRALAAFPEVLGSIPVTCIVHRSL